LVHDGYADSGHYYAFIYDRCTKNWWRFNDHTVSIESEEVVFEESYGGSMSNKTAYCMIYIDQSVASELEKHPLIHFSTGRII
jgi:ubiquitin carboxyl-terminal hydrolase 25/28